MCTLGFLTLLIMSFFVLPIYQSPSFSAAGTLISGKRGCTNINSILHLQKIRRILDQQGNINLEEDILPKEWIDEINQDNHTTDVLPWEISYCPANNITWNPSPVFQTYSAYTSFLDQWNASHYQGNQSPEFLIVEFMDIDGRHPLLGAPDTWRKVISNYEVSQKDSESGRLLLRRRAHSSTERLTLIKQENTYTNQWIPVPPSNNLVFSNINMRLHIIGSITKTTFRIPPVFIDLIRDSGRTVSYRIIPDTAQNGLLVNYIPFNHKEFAELFAGISSDRVVKFRISGPGTAYYDRKIQVEFKELSYAIEFNRPDYQGLSFVEVETLSNIETVNGHPAAELGSPVIIDPRSEENVTISGWAVDQNAGQAAAGVLVSIDGNLDIPAVYGLDRKDVADYFQNSHYRFSGFSASIATSLLGEGQYCLSLKVVSADMKSYYESNQEITLEIR
ncbi:hypothetical protein ACFLVE_02200 [Chloroflexota bacterium]